MKGFPLKVKSFRNTATYQKLRGGAPSTPPPPPLYHGRGMNLRVRPRVKQSALPGVYGYFLELHILNKVVLLTILTKWTIESRETAPCKQVIPFFTGHAD